MKKIHVILALLMVGSLAFGQTTVTYDFSAVGASTADNLDSNISFTTAQNFEATAPTIVGGQLVLDHDDVKGGSIIISPQNGVIITNVVIIASGRTNNAAYTVDGGNATELIDGSPYTINGITASNVVEFYQKQNGQNKEIDVDTFEVTYSAPTPVTYTYTGTWSPSDPNGTSSTIDNIIVVSNNATISANTAVSDVTVNPGASLTIDSGITLTTVDPAKGLTLESSSMSYSSLLLNGTISGAVCYERHVNGNAGLGDTNANGNNDLISPPLSGQTFGAFASANSNLLANPGNANEKAFAPFDKTTGDYENYLTTTNSSTTLEAGVGYRAATDNTASLTFTGTVNTGDVTNDIIISGPAHEEWNLIGNPYPSYLNVQAFLNHEVSIGITNLDLFDTATAAIYGYDGNAGTGSVDNYTIYNLATTSESTVIAPGQGFLVSTNPLWFAAFDVTFTPSMRSSGTNDDFIAGRTSDVNLNLELQISTMSKTFVTDLYFNNNASLGLDPGYDAAIFDSAPAFSIYSQLVEENSGRSFAVQALDVTDLMNTTIPLGVNANSGEQLVFSISESTLSSTVNVYLDDALNNTSTLLNSSDYIITPNTNLNGTGRFYLRVSNSTLSTPQNSLDNLSIYSNPNDRTVVIAGQIIEGTKAIIYDMQGRVVNTSILQSTNRHQKIDVSNLNAGIYVVQIVNGTQNTTQKVIIE